MKDRIDALLAEIAGLKCSTENEIEQARVRLLGKKGDITRLFEEFRNIAPEMKRELGQKLNQLKTAAISKIEEMRDSAEQSVAVSASYDLTKPGDSYPLGSRHPV